MGTQREAQRELLALVERFGVATVLQILATTAHDRAYVCETAESDAVKAEYWQQLADDISHAAAMAKGVNTLTSR